MQDTEISHLIALEKNRQSSCINLIASENVVSKDVLAAQGSILTNKYAEGYPDKRYYAGCNFVDEIEKLGIERAKMLFNCEYANLQPHSGSQANQGAFLALLDPGDKIMGLSLKSGGHLTHGAKINFSGKFYNVSSYQLDKESDLLDYNLIEDSAKKHKPKLIIAGFSAYSRKIDFSAFKEICNKIGAYLLADIAHISGLVASNYHQNPSQYADIITSTTHKTLRGARGGIILSNNKDIMKKVDRAIFPGIQGGPLLHAVAAKAVSFKEALSDSFKHYIKQVLINAKILAQTIQNRGYKILTNGTDTHIVVIDLVTKGLQGNITSHELEKLGIITNANLIPQDPLPANITSGIRLGTAFCTSIGFKEKEFSIIGNIICDVLDQIQIAPIDTNTSLKNKIKEQVKIFTSNTTIPRLSYHQ